ncbi:3'-5' exonuclease [Edaphobacillus lindanitolerans]|uniref:UvrD/REP helicase N-terminal domain-containing protein n=1 Tax=Edaphobacillus lindanitolerans TaxID=550447 RepID=A0A1U7PKF9_9BACI|nr:nuclease-related domain-containing DEAD/DEAH box helicase [Edaphobacillus lindanitolerans]SIT66096.1 UvrD/REP helicase N-terminal domain-containing protein [Edaphobacillus lindanitolerans]
MAFMIPESIRTSATAGERLLFRTMKTVLPDDVIVYYEPEIRGRRPDFVIIGPDFGLLVLEVKDYTKSTLHELNPDQWTLLTSQDGRRIVPSPMLQARKYMFLIKEALERDAGLVHAEGKYENRLKFPCGYGTVLTRMHTDDLLRLGLDRVLEPCQTFVRDEIDPDHPNFSEELFIEKIYSIAGMAFPLRDPLGRREIDAIRYHLFPEVRISAEYREPAVHQDQMLLSLKDIKAMDLHQESLAKQIGDKNRLIRGVAGSGKTLILASRAKLLMKEHPDWKILILCYNISLSRTIAAMVRRMVNEPDSLFDFDFSEGEKERNLPDTGNIEVRNFHEWLKFDLKIKEEQISYYIGKLNRKEAILKRYDAILIDEGQDFEPEWFTLVSRLLNPETKSFLLVEDRAQSIYKRKRSYIQDTGFDFRGRSKVLNINYRNTEQIVSFAWDFYRAHSEVRGVVGKQLDGEIIAPLSSKRKGYAPGLIRAKNFGQEAAFVARQIRLLHTQRSIPLSGMLILYRVRRWGSTDYVAELVRALETEGLPFYWLAESPDSKRNYDRDGEKVTISTIDSSKGLDFRAVFVVNIDNMPLPLEKDPEREASLLYIAMTRAQEYLCLTYSGHSVYTNYFDRLRKSPEPEHEKAENNASS